MPRIDKTFFNNLWLDPVQSPQFCSWIQAVQGDNRKAHCLICKKHIDLSNMGSQALTSHMQGKKHKALVESRKSQPSIIQALENKGQESSNMLRPSTSSASKTLDQDGVENSRSTLSCTNKNMLDKFISKNDTLKAEIIWCLQIVNNNLSLNSCSIISDTFRHMFSDSQISAGFQMGRTKCSYFINHGLAPYFRDILIRKISETEDFVICFDESLNTVVQRGQMDGFVRYYDANRKKIATQYLGSSFLGQANADNLLCSFNKLLEPLPAKNLLQVSMDGPNVNLSFFRKLEEEREILFPNSKQLLNIGVCGLHVIHGAMKTGLNAAKWDLHTFLRDIYYFFKDSPARRAEYTATTGSKKFPMKHCTVRWLENVQCIDRALVIFDDMKTFISNAKLPKTRVTTFLMQAFDDPFMKAKLAFFNMVSSESFLRKFQSSEPLIPFLFSHIQDLVKQLMSHFIKHNKLAGLTNKQLLALDIGSCENVLEIKNIDVGFGAKKYLKMVKSDSTTFKYECKTFLSAATKKILERSPLKYKLVRGLSCFDPKLLADNPSTGIIRMNMVLEELHSKNRISDSMAEKAKAQYFKLTEDVNKTFHSQFDSYSGDVRVDEFFANILDDKPSYKELWSIIKKCLILSHGNAAVESGFSINKGLLVENQHEESLTSQRHVKDAILYYGGILEIPLTNSLLASVRSSRSKYESHLTLKKRQKTEEEQSQAKKRKIEVELKNLKEAKKTLNISNQLKEEEMNLKIKELEKCKDAIP